MVKFLRGLTLAFLVFTQFFVTNTQAQILSYTTDTTGALNTVATNATGIALTRVNGAVEPVAPCTAGGFSTRNFDSILTYSTSLAAVQTSAAANSGYALSVTGFSVDLRRSTTGPNNVRYAYSTDGGASWIDQGIDQNPNNASCGVTITATWPVTVSVPAPAQLLFRIYGFDASSINGTFQVMNLIINGTVTSTSGCAYPSGLSASTITTTSATVSWSAVSGAVSYVLQYRPVGTMTWTTVPTTSISAVLSGLACSTTYEYQVQTVCSSGSSAFTASSTFTTLTCVTTCGLSSGLSATGITTTGSTLNWTAVTSAASYNIQYRKTGTTTWSTATSATTSVAISGLTCATSYEFQVQTVCASGLSAFTGSTTFTTLACATSGSSGKIAIYFNMPVDSTLSSGVNAINVNGAMADTLVAYINRAKYSIDIAQYDYNQTSGFANIATAVNNAYLAGKKVRWIYDGSQSNTGLALLNSGINTLGSPTTSAYGIMHNKFVIIDAGSSNPDDAILCTGSEDWGVTQFVHCHNNILFIQDSALAHVYTSEFNMMWGDTGIAPNATLSKFGPYKTDLGRHTFNIGGKTIELYFSPSDNTNDHILSSINSADTDLYFGVYDFTRSDDANAIISRHSAGVYTAGIVDQYSNTGAAYPILTGGLGTMLKTYASSSYVYHNKMVIVDPSNICSDPQVLTGSHNWTTSANTVNDENTLIIHNDTIANIYYQAFAGNFESLSGTLTPAPHCVPPTCGIPAGVTETSITSTSALVSWSAVSGASSYNIQYRVSGTTVWSSTTSGTTSVTLSGLFSGTLYEVQVEAVCTVTGLYTASSVFTTLGPPAAVQYAVMDCNTLSATPNPVNDVLNLSYSLSQEDKVSLALYNVVGQKISEFTSSEIQSLGQHNYTLKLALPGVYIVRLTIGGYSIVQKIEKN